MNIFLKIIKTILNIISTLLIIIIIINLLNITSIKVLKNDYPNFLGLTYFNMDKNNPELNINKGDILIVDFTKEFLTNDTVIYKKDKTYVSGKVINKTEFNTTISEEKNEIVLKNDLVVGKVTKKIPKLGNLLSKLLKLSTFAIFLIILIIINIIEHFINKRLNISKQSKPNFKQTW